MNPQDDASWPEGLRSLMVTGAVYAGQGLNHEGDPFAGTLVTRPIPTCGCALLWFLAVSENNEVVFHEEIMLVGRAADNRLALASASVNVPIVQSFSAGDGEDRSVEFLHRSSDGMRQSIHLYAAPDHLRIRFGWADPEMRERAFSEVELRSTGQAAPTGCPIR